MKSNLIKEKTARALFFVSSSVSIFALFLICLFLFAEGLPAIWKIGGKEFLLGIKWLPTDAPPSFGIFSMFVGSLCITLGAALLGCPLGILTAVFFSHSCPKKLYKPFKMGVELMAGIPSVVFGFFGMALIVPLLGNSILSAAILLALMIMPTVIVIAESALRAVPKEYYESALALGARHYRAVFGVVLPDAKSGVIAAVVLSAGRAIGETMAVMMVAGNQARLPRGIMKGARTLTANIALEMGYAEGLHRDALIATGAVLFFIILVVNVGFALRKKA